MSPDDPPAAGIDPADFFRADLRLGTILRAEPFPEARKPAYKLTVDFGPGVGTRTSSAQITAHYDLADLPGKRVIGVVNFPPRQIGPVKSEVLILGVHDASGAVRLLSLDEGAGAAAIGVVTSFAGFLALLWLGLAGPLAARVDVLFVTGSVGLAYLLFALPAAAVAGTLLGRVGFVLQGFVPRGA